MRVGLVLCLTLGHCSRKKRLNSGFLVLLLSWVLGRNLNIHVVVGRLVVRPYRRIYSAVVMLEGMIVLSQGDLSTLYFFCGP
jgi:hypothetical protein